MLYIKYKATPERGKHTERGWHLGTGNLPYIQGYPVSDVESVQADGDELDYVLRRFENLCRTCDVSLRVVYWYGDTAQFIVGNLT